MTPSVDAIIRAFPQLEDNHSWPVSIDGGQNALVLDLGTHIARIAHYPGQVHIFTRKSAVLKLFGPRLPLPISAISLKNVAVSPSVRNVDWIRLSRQRLSPI
jgi:hypothetical protein